MYRRCDRTVTDPSIAVFRAGTLRSHSECPAPVCLRCTLPVHCRVIQNVPGHKPSRFLPRFIQSVPWHTPSRFLPRFILNEPGHKPAWFFPRFIQGFPRGSTSGTLESPFRMFWGFSSPVHPRNTATRFLCFLFIYLVFIYVVIGIGSTLAQFRCYFLCFDLYLIL
jgi:hypothetical protein